MKQTTGLIIMVAVVGLSVLAVACDSSEGATASSAYVTAASVEDLVNESSLVVIGTVTSANPNRLEIPGKLPSDPSRPDPNYTGVAQVYEVTVERNLKGAAGSTIRVVQFEGSIISIGGQVREIPAESASYPLTSRTRYLLFLTPQGQVSGLWLGTAQPFRFALSNGLARAESPDGQIMELFPDRPESVLVKEIETVIGGG